MGRHLKDGIGTVWVKPENGGSEMVPFAEGDDVPAWAAKQMGDHCFDDSDSNEEDLPYAKQGKPDLEKAVADRNANRGPDDQIEVGGNGTKADLIAALEADDAAQGA